MGELLPGVSVLQHLQPDLRTGRVDRCRLGSPEAVGAEGRWLYPGSLCFCLAWKMTRSFPGGCGVGAPAKDRQMGSSEEWGWDGVDMGEGRLPVMCCPSSIAGGQVALGRVGAAWGLEGERELNQRAQLGILPPLLT